jgi:hypothetical protein
MNAGAQEVHPEGPGPDRDLHVTLRSTTVPAGLDGRPPMICLNCKKPLDIHQPDADLPDRLLATCEACKGWYLVECGSDGDQVIVVLLPDPSAIRGASGAR